MRRLLLGFWSLYFALVGVTNLLDGLRAVKVLPAGWWYVSGNLPLLARGLAGIRLPVGLAVLLLFGVVLWEWGAAWLFWQALHTGRSRAVDRAFMAGAGLWAAFLLADELLLVYALEEVHLRLLIAQLVSYLVIALLRGQKVAV